MKTSIFEFKIEIPIMVRCHRGIDGVLHIDSVSTPTEERINEAIAENQAGIFSRANVVV